jgi:hypothetical protein
MEEHVKIRMDYVKLVRAGKLDEAQRLLEKMWGRERPTPNTAVPEIVKVEVPVEKTVETIKPKLVNINPYSTIDDLAKIKGIGKKTVLDIKRMFKDIESLKIALINDSVSLRDDIVEKLKEVLI